MEKRTLVKDYFYPRIKEERKERLGITQERMAERLGIAARSYNDLEHGRSGVSARTLLFFLGMLTDEEIVRLVRGYCAEASRTEKDVA